MSWQETPMPIQPSGKHRKLNLCERLYARRRESMKLPSILSVACVVVVFLLVGTFNSAGFVDMNNRDRTNCGVDAGCGLAADCGSGVGQLSLQRSTRFAGESGAYLLLTFKDTGAPYDKLVAFFLDCISGRAWFSSFCREPIPFPLNKLDRELRAALT